MAETKAFSVDIDSAIEGGGLADNFNGEVTGARIDEFSYKGKGKPAIGLLLTLKNLDDPDTEMEPVFYSAGSPSEWEPTADNRGINTLKGLPGLRNSSNLYWLLKHMAEAKNGYRLRENDFTKLIGMVAFMYRVPGPPRDELAAQRAAEGNKYAQTVLVPKEIIVQPGGKKSAGATTRANAAGAAANAPTPATNADFDTKLRDWIIEQAVTAMGEGKPGVKRAALMQTANAQFCKPNGFSLSDVAMVLKQSTEITRRLGLVVDKNEIITGEVVATD